MEAENNSPVADTSGSEHIVQQFQQDISKDAYFEEESMRIKQAFSNTKQERINFSISGISCNV